MKYVNPWDKAVEFLMTHIDKHFPLLFKQSQCWLVRKCHFLASPFPAEERINPALGEGSGGLHTEGTLHPPCVLTRQTQLNKESDSQSTHPGREGGEEMRGAYIYFKPATLACSPALLLIKQSDPRTWHKHQDQHWDLRSEPPFSRPGKASHPLCVPTPSSFKAVGGGRWRKRVCFNLSHSFKNFPSLFTAPL